MIAQSVDDGASDIHFEPQAKELVVRFRIDGVLHEIMSIPRRMQSGVLSRLKIMADLDIAERRVPQDGRIGLMVGGKPIDMRVATLPTVYGEKIVMRLLDKSNVMLDLEDLGFAEKALKRFRKLVHQAVRRDPRHRPDRLRQVDHAVRGAEHPQRPEKNIITVEDPVEYRLTGINQVQVNTRAGMTFAAALRSILRCDPDIVMVGEIRDRETAQIAIESALTGHLVLSTLHTNDAPGALSRLTEMGIEPFLTSSAVDACWPSAWRGASARSARSRTRRPRRCCARTTSRRRFVTGMTSSSTVPKAARAATIPATRGGWGCTRS